MTSLFQMKRDVIDGDGGTDGQKMSRVENGGMSAPDLIVKFTKDSVVKFSPIKTLILNLNSTHRETSRLTFTFTIKR